MVDRTKSLHLLQSVLQQNVLQQSVLAPSEESDLQKQNPLSESKNPFSMLIILQPAGLVLICAHDNTYLRRSS